MILAALFFSFMGAAVKWVADTLPFMEAVFFRALITLLIIAPYMHANGIPFFGRQRFMLLLRGAAGFTALSLNFYVTTKINLADSAILNQTSTIFVAIFSVIILKEKVPTPLVIYIVCALIGVTLIVKPDWNVANVPGLLGLLSGVFAAVAYISIKELHKTESFFTMVFGFSLFSTLAPLVYWLFSSAQPVAPDLKEWVALLSLGLFGTAGQLLMTYSYKHTAASIVSPFAFSGVIFSALWGLWFWNEKPDWWSALGTLLIIVCGIGIMRLQASRNEIKVALDADYAQLPESQP